MNGKVQTEIIISFVNFIMCGVDDHQLNHFMFQGYVCKTIIVMLHVKLVLSFKYYKAVKLIITKQFTWMYCWYNFIARVVYVIVFINQNRQSISNDD